MRTEVVPMLLVSAGVLSAQGPCRPPTHLATQEPFQATHYYLAPGQANASCTPQNLPAGYRGFLTVCDLTANEKLTVSQIDFRLNDDGVIRFNWGPAPCVAGGPGLVGQTAEVNVYTTPGTWSGNWPTPSGPLPKVVVPPGPGSPWTHLAKGTLTVAPYTQHSVALFPQSFTVQVGTHGYAIEVGPVTARVAAIPYMQPPYALHPSLLLSAFAPGVPLSARDQFLAITNQDLTNQAFVTGPINQAKSALLDIHYSVAAYAAYFTPYNSGCYERPSSFYEVFPGAPALFDLSNLALRMVPAGTSYVVAATSSNVVPVPPGVSRLNGVNSGTPLADDDRTATLALGFTFPYPGGSTAGIVVTSNGNIFLNPARSGLQQARFVAFGVAGFLKGQPQLAPLWGDLDPSGASSNPNMGVYLHIDMTAPVPVAYVTWLSVPEWNVPGTSSTVQVAMFANGNVEYHYGACTVVSQSALVGWNPGWSAHDPGMRDLSASLPFTTGDGTVPPFLTMSARPVLGTTPNLVVDSVPVGAPGTLMLGQPMAPFDLGVVGMPGCLQQVMPILFLPFLASGSTASVAAPIPADRVFGGVRLTGQAIVLSPGSNVLGVTVSNPLCISLGY